jgi:hypothetical protein
MSQCLLLSYSDMFEAPSGVTDGLIACLAGPGAGWQC